MGTGTHGRRGAYKLLLCYFGANIGYRAIRYDLKCRDAVVIEIRRKVYDTLDMIGRNAWEERNGEFDGRSGKTCLNQIGRQALRLAGRNLYVAQHKQNQNYQEH